MGGQPATGRVDQQHGGSYQPGPVLVNETVRTDPRYVRVAVTDQLGEAYKEAVNRECELQGDRFRPIAERIHSVAQQIVGGRTQSVGATNAAFSIGWKDS